MKYTIIEKSWSKRRKLDHSPTITNIEFIDFEKQHNHICKMRVFYEDQSVQTLISRVIYNPIKDHWSVDGMQVAVRLSNLDTAQSTKDNKP